MAKGKDFYGIDVAEVISMACKELSAPQEELNIEVLETGSAGIFGLCKKKAHIRVTRKEQVSGKEAKQEAAQPIKKPKKVAKEQEAVSEAAVQLEDSEPEVTEPAKPVQSAKPKKQTPPPKKKPQKTAAAAEQPAAKESAPRELPSEEVLGTIQQDVSELLERMGFPSEVTVALVEYSVECRISAEHQEALVGSEGRTLDSLQYLLRKMMSRRLPDRMMLSLDVGDYRERRAAELKDRALELAEQVKEDGKTQAIAALNPSERPVVHMVLQEDQAIRSRSVGVGLFKKVLIYKPGKKKKSGSRKGKGRQSGHSSGNQ